MNAVVFCNMIMDKISKRLQLRQEITHSVKNQRLISDRQVRRQRAKLTGTDFKDAGQWFIKSSQPATRGLIRQFTTTKRQYRNKDTLGQAGLYVDLVYIATTKITLLSCVY
jgi:hypothetical protein